MTPTGYKSGTGTKMRILVGTVFLLQLAAASVPLGGPNLALRKPARQSSTYNNDERGYSAHKAVDGAVETEEDVAFPTFSHTKSDVMSWWAVDLLYCYQITDVVIYNRKNGYTALANFNIDVGMDMQFKKKKDCEKAYGYLASAAVKHYSCAHSDSSPFPTGRWVRIQRRQQGVLALREVKVYGRDGTMYFCDGSDMHLSCANGTHIKLQHVNYGRLKRNICVYRPLFGDMNIKCASSSPAQVLKGMCEGKQKCSMRVSMAKFGNPCANGMYTDKYLEVNYYCESGGFLATMEADAAHDKGKNSSFHANPCKDSSPKKGHTKWCMLYLWHKAGCTSDYPGKKANSEWWCKQEVETVLTVMKLYKKYADEGKSKYMKKCYGGMKKSGK